MSADYRFSKFEILFRQNKFSEAEKILKDLLSQDPHNVKYLIYFAEVNLKQGKYKVAREVIENALGLSPDNPLLFYVRGRIAFCQKAYEETEMNLKRCIELDPGEADYVAFLAYIKLEKKDFEEALALADQALELNAENLLGLNIRGSALLKFNRKTESFDTFESALRKDPDNASTHGSYGWALLEMGEHQKAKEHFKESLKIDPNFEFAQTGLLQVIKATNPLYRVYSKYDFLKDNLTFKFQLGVVIAFYLGMLGLHLAGKNEALQPYLNPLIVTALAIVAFSTWVIIPISNLFLRFNKYGHLLLTKSEKISSNFAAAGFAAFITGGGLYIFTKEDTLLQLAFFGFAMVVLSDVLFSPSKPEPILLISASSLFLLGLLVIIISFIYHDIHHIFSMIFLYSFIGFQFLTNFFQIKKTYRWCTS